MSSTIWVYLASLDCGCVWPIVLMVPTRCTGSTNKLAQPALERQTMSNLANFVESHTSFVAHVIDPILEAGQNYVGVTWAYAAHASGSGASGIWEACEMSYEQQRVIFAIGERLGQVMRPLTTTTRGVCVWCHRHVHVGYPCLRVAWSRLANGDWQFAGSEHCAPVTVSLDGTLVEWSA